MRGKRHSLRFERNAVCALCAAAVAVFAGAAVAGWLAAPVPVGAVLTGVAAFVLLFCGLLAGGWVRYTARYFALARAQDFPCCVLGEDLSLVFYALPAETVAAYLRASASLPPLPQPCTREQWAADRQKRQELESRFLGGAARRGYPALCPRDVCAVAGKTILLSRRAYESCRALFDYAGLRTANAVLVYDEPSQTN